MANTENALIVGCMMAALARAGAARLSLVLLAVLLTYAGEPHVFAEKGAFVDRVRFIQYLDENTALEEVRNGNLDMYYYNIPADRLEGADSREGLSVYDSTGGAYSILVNPAESDKFNPFASKQARFALNYLVDRKLIVNELMGGFGSPAVSYYGQHDPEYMTVLAQVESFNFRYNPKLAEGMITASLQSEGAVRADGQWMHGGVPIEITVFIRSDDPVRKSIGEILSSRLQDMGFVINKEFGDLNKAFVVVYGSDPAQLKWNLYTEGWGRSAFVRYDSVGLGQMYSPWFSNMPGFNDPNYWNYENEELDSLTQKIYAGEFDTKEERAGLIQEAVEAGIDEAVRIFLASRTDQYVAGRQVSGVVNDFGAGIPSRFTPINARSDDGELAIGVKQIYQGAWNPVMGLSDSYSRHIWGIVSDPATFKHPFTGETFPVRASWEVKTMGPHEKMGVPADAVMWDVDFQEWRAVPDGSEATSMATFDFEFGNWHHGQRMDMTDILHSLYFTIEWGTHAGKDDRTFDAEFTPRAAQIIDTIKGIRQVGDHTMEVYVDYWHFDDGEIADWASLWSTVPWEVSAAMEQAVLDGKASFSRSGATSKNVNWLSLIVPNDAHMLREYMDRFRTERHVPASIIHDADWAYLDGRYGAAAEWISSYDHAVISNGPFYLDSYSPESRTITANAFADETYPFGAGHWSDFDTVKYPTIKSVRIPDSVQAGATMRVLVETENADGVLYFVTGGDGTLVSSQSVRADNGVSDLVITGAETSTLKHGAGSVKIFAVSEDVLRPDLYSAGFLITEGPGPLPKAPPMGGTAGADADPVLLWLVVPAIGAAVLAAIAYRRRSAGKAVPLQD